MKLLHVIKRTPPWLTLLLIAPILGELVSAHQSPLEFLNPINFLVLSLPYGIGALLCREFIVRWKKGLPGLLLLGIAYGIYEEGIVVHSFFNPNWTELGALARYGFYGGINWTWSECMVHFHTFISIGASILLTEIIYPAHRDKKWLNNKGLVICMVGFLAWIPLGLLMTDYFPPLPLYAVTWVVFIGLILAAYFLPALPAPTKTVKATNPIFFFMLGAVNMTVFFLTVFLTPEWKTPPPLIVTVLFLAALDTFTIWLIKSRSGNGYDWNDCQRLALVAGLLAFFVYFCFDKDLQNFTGTSFVGLGAIIGIVMLWKTVISRETRKKNTPEVNISTL
jgi:hypothetical protein